MSTSSSGDDSRRPGDARRRIPTAAPVNRGATRHVARVPAHGRLSGILDFLRTGRSPLAGRSPAASTRSPARGRTGIAGRTDRSLRPLTLRSGPTGRWLSAFPTIHLVLGGLLVGGLLVLRGLLVESLVLDHLLPATAALDPCFQQAQGQPPECLQQLEGQLTQEPEQQHGPPNGEGERGPDATE